MFHDEPEGLNRLRLGLVFLAIALALFAAARLALYLRYPEAFESLGTASVLGAFANGLRFDGAVLGRILAIPLLLLWLPGRWFDQRWWTLLWGWSIYLLTLGLVLLLAGDIVYFQHVQRHVSYELILLKNDLGFLVDFGLKAHFGALIGFILFAIALGWLWAWLLRRVPAASRWSVPKFALLFLALLVVGRGGVSGKVIEIIDAYSGGDAAYGHLSLNGAFTTIVFALNMEEVDHPFTSEAEALAALAERREVVDERYPMLQRYAGDEANGRNLVFVLLESWNFDYVDSFGGGDYGVTPHFDAMAAEGLRFTRFYAAGQRSIEGIQATLTGIPALKGLPRIDAGIGVSNISRLGALVREHGYSTLFVQSSARDSFKIAGIAEATGFERFNGMEDIPLQLEYPDPDGAIFGWDYDTLQFMKGRIDEMQEPFLAYAFTGTTHEPYAELPRRFRVREHEANGEGGYLNALAYADWSLGQFIEAARAEPWFENTTFIFTADHVNHFQKGDFLKRFHIPMLVYAPGAVVAGESRVVGSQLDVMPTILDLLGVEAEFAALGGSLLRKDEDSEVFITEGGQNIILLNGKGWLRHNLARRISSGGSLSEAELASMERRLLAYDQLSYELLQANRWSR